MVILLIIIILLLAIIIWQNNEILSQLNVTGNYLSDKIDTLSSYIKMLDGAGK